MTRYPRKAIHFMKTLASVEKEKNQVLKEDLKGHLNKIKKIVDIRGNAELYDEIRYLENKIKKVMSIVSDEDVKINEIKKHLEDIEKSVLFTCGSSEMKKQLDKVTFLLSELSSRVDTFIKIKSDREERIVELEKKIKKNVSHNLKEILLLEKQIVGLERKYVGLKDNSTISSNQLKRIENKLDLLKQRLLEKRHGVIEKKQKIPPPIIKKTKFNNPKLPKKIIHPKPVQVKHEMLFPKPVKPKEPEIKPKTDNIPPPPQIPKLEEPKRKKWYEKIFGK